METSKEEEPVFLDRASRLTRGKRMAKLLADDVEEDKLFWNQDALKEGWNCQRNIKFIAMDKEDILGNNRIEDVRWLCSLSDSELDMLISLKMLVIQRAKTIGHDALAKKFDLKMLRALGFILMERLNGQLKDLSISPGLAEPSTSLDGCNLLKRNLNDNFGTMSIEELRKYIGTDHRKRMAEIFGEEMAPRQKKKTDSERLL